MFITLPRSLENDIMEFCNLNDIKDINSFLVNCLRDGFNIIKYGSSPQDNFNKENKPLKIDYINDYKEKDNVGGLEKNEAKRRGRPRKDDSKKEESLSGQEAKKENLTPQKKIRIIKN